ncbi:kinase-like domain-containing protein [Ilyonectria destructans]|nr:kinase-like domain-containing protein [Ilyonectria destructans]
MARTVSKEQLSKATRLSTWSPVFKIDSKTIMKTGDIVRMAEAEVMKFVHANTSIPVPEVHSAYRDEASGHVVILMDFMEGENLDKAWPGFTEAERESVVSQLLGYMAQLRSFKGTFIGSIDGTACNDQYFCEEPEGYGPYQSEEEFNQGVVAAMKKDRPYTFVDWKCDVWTNVLKGHEIVLTHNDLDPRNILVQGSKVVAILDWELSGYYPEYWEYCKAVGASGWEDAWSRSRAVDRILKPYHQELAVFWNSREVIH